MPTDRTLLKLASAGGVGSAGLAVNPLLPLTGAVAASHTKYYTAVINLPDAGAALLSGLAESVVAQMPVAGKVVFCSFTSPVAISLGAAAVVATWTLAKRTGAGAAATICQQSNLTAGGTALAAFVPYVHVAGDYTAANTNVAANDVLTFKIVKGATGVVLTTATSAAAGVATISQAVTLTIGVEEV